MEWISVSIWRQDYSSVSCVNVQRHDATYYSRWYTVDSQQGWDTLPTQAVKRLSKIDEDDDTTSSCDLETFSETPKAKNVLRTCSHDQVETRSDSCEAMGLTHYTGRSRFNSTRLHDCMILQVGSLG